MKAAAAAAALNAAFFAAMMRAPGANAKCVTETIVEAGYQCKKFHDIYADGKDLIEKMWGDAFVYETDLKSVLLWFFGENPNNGVTENILAKRIRLCAI